MKLFLICKKKIEKMNSDPAGIEPAFLVSSKQVFQFNSKSLFYILYTLFFYII